MKKLILKTFAKVALFIIAYFAVRYLISLVSANLAFGWETGAVLLVIITLTVFIIQYSIKGEKSVFLSWQFMLLFTAGILFWVPDRLPGQVLLFGVASFLLFFIILSVSSIKSMKEPGDGINKSVKTIALMCSIYLLILPAVALGEMFF